MCGIIGLLSSTNRTDLTCTSLSHRGPDTSSCWQSHENEFPVWLGHTRLAILDLSPDGNQPMHSSCGRYVIVFNGEIYNFLELREALELRGYKFRTQTDTEVLLVGLIHEGPNFQLKCNGMWAFCLWDRQKNTALLSRDRFGIKPLFYTRVEDTGFAFASEMKALYSILPSLQPSDHIQEHFQNLFNYEHTEHCVIAGIKRIPPGHWILWDAGRLTTYRWWNTLDHLEISPVSYDEQVERWRELFLDAVRLRMRADVPIGTALSGGLDSSAIFCSMAYLAQGLNRRQSADWQHGFCSSYPGSSLDETDWARMVTDHVGVPLEEVKINPLNGKWSIQESLYQVEDPYLTLPLPMLETYRAMAQSGIKVTLDGHGADELFSGYGGLSTILQRVATPAQMAEILAIEKSVRTNSYQPDLQYPWIKQKFSRSLLKVRKNIAQFRGRLPAQVDFSFDDQNHPAFKEMDPLGQSLYEIFHITILPTLLRNYDRYSMASGIEVRMPFMDWRLVCFVFSLPWTSKIGGSYTKRIVRNAMVGIMPEPIRTRRSKIGWNAPLHEWFRGPLKEEINDLVYSHAFGLPSDAVALWKSFQAKSEPTYLDAERLWCKLMPAFWYRSLELK